MSTLSDVSVEIQLPINTLLSVSIYSEVNNHTIAHITAVVNSTEIDNIIHSNLLNPIKIFIDKKLVFRGMVSKIDLETNSTESYRLSLCCISNSIFLHKSLDNIFFQDCSRTYADIVSSSAKNAYISSFVTATKGKTAISRSILQYNETAWEFALRVASYISTVIVVDERSDTPGVCLGFPKRDKYSYESIKHTSILIRKQLNHKKQINREQSVPNKNILQNIVFSSIKMLKIGDIVDYYGEPLYIIKKSTTTKGSFLIHQYTLADEEAASVPLHFNKNIHGLELYGEVIEKSGLALKVKLDIFNPSDIKTWIEYAPITNNAMYSIPLLGEKVALQWQGYRDEDMLITHCMRNRSLNLPTHIEKHFKTDYKNRLSFMPSAVDILSPNNNVNVIVNGGVSQTSKRKITVKSSENISLFSKHRIRISSPELIDIKALNRKSQISMHTDTINIRSKNTFVSSDPCGVETTIMLNPKIKTASVKPSVASKIAGSIPTQI